MRATVRSALALAASLAPMVGGDAEVIDRSKIKPRPDPIYLSPKRAERRHRVTFTSLLESHYRARRAATRASKTLRNRRKRARRR